MKHRWSLFAAVAIAAAALGFYFGHTPAPTDTPPSASAGGADLMQLQLASLDGKATSLRPWQGKVLVVNFWATWCPPCREEMPEFSRVQTQLANKGVQFVGIGIDTPDNILAFQKSYPVSYPLLLGSYAVMQATVALGNTASALPFTVILDRNGRIVHTKSGKLSEAELQRLLPPLYAAAKQ